jgi:hypothetical protein
MSDAPKYRFSGHESFPCRYAWLPKAFQAIGDDPEVFSDEEEAMVTLGVGKNMVRSIRFWMQVSGIARARERGGYDRSEFGKILLKRGGTDPYLEDRRTLWLIHWQMATQVSEPLFAWDFLLNGWLGSAFSRTEVLEGFRTQSAKLERKLSPVTLSQHFDTFLHTYVPTQGKKSAVQEDTLDCPLVELELIQRVGERSLEGLDSRESLYAFNRDRKEEITGRLFAFCLDDFWKKCLPGESTLQLSDVANARYSPGRIFRLSEWDVRERLENIEEDSDGAFQFVESALFQRITRENKADPNVLLSAIYESEATTHA